MFFQYNGVILELVQLDRVERESVYSSDGQDLMYVRWVIGATCVFSPGGYPVGVAAKVINGNTMDEVFHRRDRNPGDMLGSDPHIPAFKQEANNRPSFAAGRGYNAVLTDAELKTRLWIPRQQLLIWAYDDITLQKVIWLEAPKPGFVCDMMGGPKPIAVDVVSVSGEGKTFGVHMQIETAQSPCPYYSDRLILSHRWEMSHDHDENHYLTRTIKGEVVFNQAFIQTNGVRPDWMRNQLYHPIPLGFTRKLGPVVQSSDGGTLSYEIYDTDSTIVFDAGDSGATQMEIVENLRYTQPWRTVGGKNGGGAVNWWALGGLPGQVAGQLIP